MIFRFGYANKLGFIIAPGLTTSILQSAKFKLTGTSTQKGYYPARHVVLENIEEYNYSTKEYSETVKYELNSFNISASLLFALSIPIGKKAFLNTGFRFNYGLLDLAYTKSAYRDDFINIFGVPEKTTLQSIGINFNFIYKF